MQKESEVVEREMDAPPEHTLDRNHLLERIIRRENLLTYSVHRKSFEKEIHICIYA